MFDLEGFTEVVEVLSEKNNPHAACRNCGRGCESTAADTEIPRRAQVGGHPICLLLREFDVSERAVGTRYVTLSARSSYVALIGTYSGREDNSLYRKSESGFVLQGGKMLGLKEAIPLGEAVIRSVPTRLIRSQRRSTSMAAISLPCRHRRMGPAHLRETAP
jgi:hypothetical protein